jgi:hypothetical protein
LGTSSHFFIRSKTGLHIYESNCRPAIRGKGQEFRFPYSHSPSTYNSDVALPGSSLANHEPEQKHVSEASLPDCDSLESQLFENPERGGIGFVNAGYYLGEARLSACMRDRCAGHLCGVSSTGKPLKHRIHELRFGVNGWELQKSAETYQLIRRFAVNQPYPDATPLEQSLTLSDALLAPLPGEQVTVHQVSPHVLVLYEAVEGVEICGIDRLVS